MVMNGITFNDHDRDAVEKLRVSNPQSLIDTDFEYSLQNTKWEFLSLCNNYPGVYSRANEPAFTSEQIVSIIPSGVDNKSVTVTVNTLPRAPFKIGDSIVLKETTNTTFVDGAYIITAVLSPFSFQVVTRSPVELQGDQKTQYTALYTGGFYTNANLPIIGVSSLPGTSAAVIQFRDPHNLYIGTPITVVDFSLSAVPWSGTFAISAIRDDYSVIYQTLTGNNYTSITLLIPSTGAVYARTEGVAIHRFFDGGIQINPGTSAPNARAIRQTRKYFKYQSGKSLQFSTGVLFKPVYEVTNAYIDSSVYNSVNYPYFDFVITTEQYHGFAQPNTYREGVTINTYGFQVSSGNVNPYNKTFTVNKVINTKTFSVQIPVNPSFNPFTAQDREPGGTAYVSVRNWNDATVRTGLFDDQNGLFFEFDGLQFWVVKRQTTTPLNGTVRVVNGSSWVVSTEDTTEFKSQLKENDYISIQGTTYQIGSIINDLSASITPTYRGISGKGYKVIRTEEQRFSQPSFNLDKLDGTGPSGYVLNLNTMQMVFIDYAWYGAGKVRFGIRSTEGKIIYFHEIYNNNVNIKAYMRSGNLPGRFEISSLSRSGTLLQDVTIVSNYALVSPSDADNLPARGRIIINNEYIEYTKGVGEGSGIRLNFNQRNVGGLTSGPRNHSKGDQYISFNQNCSPALSHWGVAALMDGNFNEDKSYLFTATNDFSLSALSADKALVSLRLAPSVDYGIIGRRLGERNLINRSTLKLRKVGILTNNPIQINIRVNCEPQTTFTNLSAWKFVANGSIAQYYDHTLDGSFDVEGTGGDLIASFLLTPNAVLNSNVNITEEFDLEVVRDLTNSILGGNFPYPDGPDIVTVSIKTLASYGNYSATCRGRISWTEDQG